jgi:LETM1 and EF-hand domain-containing protein 1
MQKIGCESFAPTPSSSLLKRRNISSYHHENAGKTVLWKDHDADQFKIYKDMSKQFYITMHRVLLRSNTNINSSNVFNRPEFMSCNSFATHGGHPFCNTHSLINARSFSSAASSDGKNKEAEKKDASNSASTTQSSDGVVPSSPKSVSLKKKDETISEKAQAMLKSGVTSLASMIAKTPGILYFYMTHPKEFKEKMLELKEAAKKEAHHYYMGSKLLIADIKTARQILARTLNGTTLTRRERKQLLRTVTDVFRLVPMSIFVLIPFMEFALPFALKIWPNMLPSTFQDNLKAEENMKRELKSRLAMAEFFQE